MIGTLDSSRHRISIQEHILADAVAFDKDFKSYLDIKFVSSLGTNLMRKFTNFVELLQPSVG